MSLSFKCISSSKIRPTNEMDISLIGHYPFVIRYRNVERPGFFFVHESKVGIRTWKLELTFVSARPAFTVRHLETVGSAAHFDVSSLYPGQQFLLVFLYC